jgi:hypothetical protein
VTEESEEEWVEDRVQVDEVKIDMQLVDEFVI